MENNKLIYDARDHSTLNDKQIELSDFIREYSLKNLRSKAHIYDVDEANTYEMISEAANDGIYNIDFFKEAFSDTSGLSLSIIAEEFAYGDAGLALSILYPALPLTLLYLFANKEQEDRILPELLGKKDAPKITSFAASEPNAGSDLGSMSTFAQKVEGGYLLNGSKRWSGNTGKADAYFVLANTDKEIGKNSQTFFYIEKGAKGLSFENIYKKIGLRSITNGDIILENVFVPDNNIIGGTEYHLEKLETLRAKKGKFPHQALSTFHATRPFVSSMAVGLARAAHEDAVLYASQRSTFGKYISEHQQISAIIASQRTQIDAARLLVRKASSTVTQISKGISIDGSVAKLFASNMVREVTASSLQIAGGLGYTTQLPFERYYRNAPIYGIFEGTDQVQSLIIASTIFNKKIR